jgi:transcriptional regulator with XRE-family HTH domain|tara:strand:+ start:587 stop:811 length:225 start_codon:yes stop_codon:yes gene_type:complete
LKKKNSTFWSQLLREIRIESGLTQQALADRCELSRGTIAEYESQRAARQLSIYRVEHILDALGYEMDAFLKGDG